MYYYHSSVANGTEMRIWFCIGLVLVFTDLVNSKPVTKILNLVNEHNDEGYHFK